MNPLSFLEKKRFSITRLKHRFWFCWQFGTLHLEKKRFSITRLKLRELDTAQIAGVEILEKKRFSITRLKLLNRSCECVSYFILKRKDSRLRDWNFPLDKGHAVDNFTLEKKRFSITRLKQWIGIDSGQQAIDLKRKDSRLRDWNCIPFQLTIRVRQTWKEKILDYEIETHHSIMDPETTLKLEKKRFSITRLKQAKRFFGWCNPPALKRKDSRLRDWNKHSSTSLIPVGTLKRKDSRLRDWNPRRKDTL